MGEWNFVLPVLLIDIWLRSRGWNSPYEHDSRILLNSAVTYVNVRRRVRLASSHQLSSWLLLNWRREGQRVEASREST